MGCSLSKTSAISLADEDIDFLTKNTKYSSAEIREWYSGFQRDCPNGRLSKKKFIEIYSMFFTSGNPQHFCEHVYRTFDEDNDGSISFKEFLLAIGVTTGSNSKDKLKWAFKMYDINKDGEFQFSSIQRKILIIFGSYFLSINRQHRRQGNGKDHKSEYTLTALFICLPLSLLLNCFSFTFKQTEPFFVCPFCDTISSRSSCINNLLILTMISNRFATKVTKTVAKFVAFQAKKIFFFQVLC